MKRPKLLFVMLVIAFSCCTASARPSPGAATRRQLRGAPGPQQPGTAPRTPQVKAPPATVKTAPVPAAEGCYAENYAELLAHTRNPHCQDADLQDVGIEMDLDIECNDEPWERGTMDALSMTVDLAKTWIISTDSECTKAQVINIDLSQNPTLPLFTVTGDLAYNKIVLEDLKFVVFGTLPPPADCEDDEPCNVPALIDIVNIEDIELRRITITSRDNQQLPFTGIKITTTAGGSTSIVLDNVTVNHCADGVLIDGGGNLVATNNKITGNSHYGLIYMCSFVQASSVNISGAGSLYSNNNQSGIFVDCDGDLSPPLQMELQDGVRINSNGGSGVVLEGHMHAHVGRVSFQGNGKGVPPPDCGGGLEVHFEYSSPELVVDGAEFVSNTAQYGGGMCIEVPKTEDDFMGMTKGPVEIKAGTKFLRNVATKCGGAMATVFDFQHTQLAVKVSKDVRVASNKAPRAVGWCMMPTYDGTQPNENLYTSIDINN